MKRLFTKVFAKKSQAGFTLMELIIVIALIGILSVGGLASYVNSQRRSRDAKRQTDLETIRQALELFKADFSQYPPASLSNELSCDTSVGAFINNSSCNPYGAPISYSPIGNDWSYSEDSLFPSDLNKYLNVSNKYISKLPVDPQNSATNYYYYEPTCDQSSTNCGQSVDCTDKGCCAYYLGVSKLEATGTKYEVCNP